MAKFRDWLFRANAKYQYFMQGRNGVDALAKAENILLWILLAVMLFFSWVPGLSLVLSLLFWALAIHTYYRIFSKKLNARYRENNWYIDKRRHFKSRWARRKNEFQQRADYRFFSCPDCKQRVRVPKGRGKICITCPKCRKEFTRKS